MNTSLTTISPLSTGVWNVLIECNNGAGTTTDWSAPFEIDITVAYTVILYGTYQSALQKFKVA